MYCDECNKDADVHDDFFCAECYRRLLNDNNRLLNYVRSRECCVCDIDPEHCLLADIIGGGCLMMESEDG